MTGLILRRPSRAIAAAFALVALMGCSQPANPPPQAIQVAPTLPLPAPTPNIGATVEAAVAATIQALRPTSTPIPAPTAAPVIDKLTNENWGLAISDANRFKKVPVVLTGRIFLEPQRADVLAFQMYTNRDATDGNTIVVAEPSVNVSKGDFVRVRGVVLDQFEGKNAFGGTLTVPRITATSVEIVTREEVVAPAIASYKVNKQQNQQGLLILLDHVDLAERETRVYVKVRNESTEKGSASSYGAKLVQDSRQLEPKTVFDGGYPSLPSDILPGVEATGVIVFDAVKPGTSIRFVWDGPRLSNFRLNFTPYQWSIEPS